MAGIDESMAAGSNITIIGLREKLTGLREERTRLREELTGLREERTNLREELPGLTQELTDTQVKEDCRQV